MRATRLFVIQFGILFFLESIFVMATAQPVPKPPMNPAKPGVIGSFLNACRGTHWAATPQIRAQITQTHQNFKGAAKRAKLLQIGTTQLVNLTPDDVIALVKAMDAFRLSIGGFFQFLMSFGYKPEGDQLLELYLNTKASSLSFADQRRLIDYFADGNRADQYLFGLLQSKPQMSVSEAIEIAEMASKMSSQDLIIRQILTNQIQAMSVGEAIELAEASSTMSTQDFVLNSYATQHMSQLSASEVISLSEASAMMSTQDQILTSYLQNSPRMRMDEAIELAEAAATMSVQDLVLTTFARQNAGQLSPQEIEELADAAASLSAGTQIWTNYLNSQHQRLSVSELLRIKEDIFDSSLESQIDQILASR